MTSSVVVKNVTKCYKMYNKNSDKILDIFLGNKGEEFYALRGVTFTAEKGDVIGIIGVNGSGKSTLSNIISGVIPPTEGTVKSKGSTSLIAIASGLKSELTGRENIELKCLMLGFSKKEIRKLEPEIIEFAEIGKFIDQPVKSYSSGMKSRLGFAISVTVNPDILVIDEALSVGDQAFADKCLDKMNSFKEQGKTIFFISHSIGQVKKFCDKALWLENGMVRDYGLIDDIVPKYQKFLKEYKQMTPEQKKAFQQDRLNKNDNVQQQELSPSKVLEVKQVESNDIPSRSQERKHKKKRKGNKKRRLFTVIFCLLVICIIGIVGYNSLSAESLNSVKSVFKHEGNSKAKNKAVTDVEDNGNNGKISTNRPVKEAKTEQNVEMAVVSKSQVNLRDKASLNSSIVGSATFGDAFIIKEKQSDPNEDGVNWFKVILPDNSNAWVSSSVVQDVNSTDHEMKAEPTLLSNLLEQRHLPSDLGAISDLFSSTFTKIKKDYSNQIVSQNNTGQLETLNLSSASLVGQTQADTLEQVNIMAINQNYASNSFTNSLGAPVLSDELDGIYVYFEKQLEIKVYVSTNGKMNKITFFKVKK
ncbi:hypothetical protein GCM10011391_39480 [Pullulanibacillus camelliae]|uniref:Teichoic acids export ATP-binding protein TagH n=1 Tax=Pullulanibacillus camelliae TaxID=1707096 RepID=A0A8J3E292_9BACL|nr:teichoic acids export ABC transporter ATP-binding subunit TagH [Pullulanibacillus camelliae]GGE56667.1 hypothetical protein GCM10011391_39480 [Pullulanibacillus camelliae]